jgi:hypothetical protein
MTSNKNYPILTIELVPSTQWGSNLRTRLPRKQWDKLRKECYRKASHVCEVCSEVGPKWPVECHEKWDYNEETKMQTLTGLIALCPNCHLVKHFGRACSIGKKEEALSHFLKVNSWSSSKAEEYIEQVFNIWQKRSNHSWSLDLSWLENRETEGIHPEPCGVITNLNGQELK